MINMDSRLQNLWLHLLIFSMVTLGTTNSDNFVPTGLVLFVLLGCLQRKNMCAPVCAIFPSSPCTLFLRISTHFHPNLQGSCSSTCVYIQSTHRAEACSGTAQPCCVLCCSWEPCFPRSPISQRVHLWGSHGLNIHGVEPSLMTVPHWWLFDLVFDLKPPWLSSWLLGEMHPGPLASAGDGCLAGQGDSARLMPDFFERNIAVEMACFETLSSITHTHIYINISVQIAWCFFIVGSHRISSTHFSHRFWFTPGAQAKAKGPQGTGPFRECCKQASICQIKALKNEHL